MAVRPLSHPPAPFTAPVSGTLDQRLAGIAAAINRKADAGVQGPAYQFLALISPDGSTWRVMVDDAGAISTQQVPRT
jgi:hypothetical protein